MDRDAIARLLCACGDTKKLIQGRLIHSQILDHLPDRYLCNLLVQMYGKCGSMEEARKVFEEIPYPNTFSWTIIMNAYAQNGDFIETRKIFDGMSRRNVVTWTSLISAYAQLGHMQEAMYIFQKLPESSLVSWNGMITAYGQNKQAEQAKYIFDSMPGRNSSSWNALVTANAQNGHLHQAKEVYMRMPERNFMAWNPIIHAYNLRGDVSNAKAVFESLPETAVSTATMISGFAQTGHADEARALFEILEEPDEYAWTSMLHAYTKVGNVCEAFKMFSAMPLVFRDTPAWNAMLAAYAQNGYGKETLDLLTLMLQEGISADEKSFTIVLHACSHMGSLKDARFHFLSLQGDHQLSPDRELFCSMVDVLGRNGKLAEAEDLIHNMPFLPDQAAWASLLAACRLYNDTRRAPGIAEKFIHHLDCDPSPAAQALAAEPYVQLANIYRSDDVSWIRRN